MFSYLTNLILLFLLFATISESQTTTSSSTSTTTVAPVSSTTTSTTSTTSTSSPATTTTTTTKAATTTTAAATTTTTKATKATNATNGTTVTTLKLIKSNVTSNYFLFPYVDINGNFTLPFAINECSSINLNASRFIKPMCVSTHLLNVTFYNNSKCTSKAEHHELINDTSLFICNSSNNYAELSMSANTSCPGISKTYVGIGSCFPTLTGYASFLCSGKYLQYVTFNSSSDSCNNNGLSTISQVNSTLCGPLFNDSIYTSVAKCVNNATKSSSSSTTTTSTSKPSNSSSNSSSSTTTTSSTTSSTTKLSTTSSGSTTTTSSSTSSSTTRSSKKSSASSVFILNNVVYILSIITIMNIILC